MKKNKRLCGVWVAMCLVTFAVSGDTTDTVLGDLRRKPDDKALIQNLKGSLTIVSAPDERCRLGVIYCLGMLAFGDVDEGLSVREKIVKAFGSNPAITDLSEAMVFDDCPKCEAGKTQAACVKCLGTKTCPVCGGGGKSKTKGFNGNELACGACKGNGQCSYCKGTGEGLRTCTDCFGRGRSLSKSKCKENYLKLLKPEPDIAAALLAKDSAVSSGKGVVVQNGKAVAAEALAEAPIDPFSPGADDAYRRADAKAARIKLEEQVRIDGSIRTMKANVEKRMASSELFRAYGVTKQEIDRFFSDELTQIQKSKVFKDLRDRALPLLDKRELKALFMPFPDGLKYTIDDVSKRGDDYVISLNSDDENRKAFTDALMPTFVEGVGLGGARLLVPPADGYVEGLNKKMAMTSDGWVIIFLLNKLEEIGKERFVYKSEKDVMYFLERTRGSSEGKGQEGNGILLDEHPNVLQNNPAAKPQEKMRARNAVLNAEIASLRREIEAMKSERSSHAGDINGLEDYTRRREAKEALLKLKMEELYQN